MYSHVWGSQNTLGNKYALHLRDIQAPPNKSCMPKFPPAWCVCTYVRTYVCATLTVFVSCVMGLKMELNAAILNLELALGFRQGRVFNREKVKFFLPHCPPEIKQVICCLVPTVIRIQNVRLRTLWFCGKLQQTNQDLDSCLCSESLFCIVPAQQDHIVPCFRMISL